MRRVLIVIGAVAIAATGAYAADSPATVVCPRLQAAPAIDGQIGADEWSEAGAIAPFALEGGGLPAQVTEAFVGYDETALYVAARMSDPQPAQMQCAATARDGAVEADDSLAVMLDPGDDGAGVMKLAVNAAGVELDTLDGNTDATVVWRSAAAPGDGVWQVEIAYIFGTEGMPSAGATWGFSLRRNAPRIYERSSMTGGGLGTMVFGRPPLRAEVEPPNNPWFGANTLPVRLTNLGTSQQTVKVNVRVSGHGRRAHWFETTKLTLTPGEARDVPVSYQVQRGGRCEMELSVQVVEGTEALTALRTAGMRFELPPLGEELDEALSYITDAYQTYVRIPAEARPFDGGAQLDMLLARWRYLDSQHQQRASLTPDTVMALLNRAQSLSEDAVLLEKQYAGLVEG